jgi:hypothetical protein
MKKLYTTMMLAFVAMSASAQDSTYVRVDFNQNPWNLPVSIPNRDKGMVKENGKQYNWSVVDDETGCMTETQAFDWNVDDGKIMLTLTPSNYKLTDYDNAMVKTHDLNEADEPIYTMLWMRAGAQLSFKAPEKMWFAKVVFGEYRNWASGSLYSGEVTDNHHVWGKDSVKTRITTAGGQEYILECWSGDSVEWSLPASTGNTYLKYIDFWLLPRNDAAGIDEVSMPRERVNVYSINGVVMRRDRLRRDALNGLRPGLYIMDGKKIVVK